MTILDDMRRQAIWQGLIQGGANMLAASGPSFQPRNAVSALGAGFGGFGQGVQKGMQQGMQQALTATKLQEAQRRAEALKAFQGLGQPPTAVAQTPTFGTPQGGGGPHGGMRYPAGAQLTEVPKATLTATQQALQTAWAQATPEQRRKAQMLAATGDLKGAQAALFERPKWLPTGWRIGPDGKPYMPEEIKQFKLAEKRAGADRTTLKVINRMRGNVEGRAMLAKEAREQAAKLPKNDPRRRELLRRADALDRANFMGEKSLPQDYRQAAAAVSTATSAMSKLAGLLNNPNITRYKPQDRALIKQQLQQIGLAYATLKGRGANFTESEQAKINAIIGGDPTSLQGMTTRSRANFVSSLREAHRALVREWQATERAFRTGRPTITPFPGQAAPTSGGVVPKGAY